MLYRVLLVFSRVNVAFGDNTAFLTHLRLQHLRPRRSATDSPQIVVYKAPDNTIQIGMVLTVFRGALTRKQGENLPRKLRLSKAAAFPLPLGTCSMVRLVHMTECQTQKYFACALSPQLLVAPAGHIIGEIHPATIQQSASKCVVVLSEAASVQLQALREKPQLLLQGSGNYEEPDVAAKAEVPALDPGTVFTAADFTRSVAGTKNLEAWLHGLPTIWKNHGVAITNEQNCLKVNGKIHNWNHLVRRVPEWFDVVYDGPSKGYGKAVMAKLLRFMPEGNLSEAKNRLLAFLADVDQRTQPVSMSQYKTCDIVLCMLYKLPRCIRNLLDEFGYRIDPRLASA